MKLSTRCLHRFENKLARVSISLSLTLALTLPGAVASGSQLKTASGYLPPGLEPGTTEVSNPSHVSKAELDKLGMEYVTTRVIAGTAQKISEYKLKRNGLSILLSERRVMPIVNVMIVYHVGSRNEAVGYTGSTHFLEHMMFKGTTRHDPDKGTGLDDILKPTGGFNNATTSYDRTNYFEIVPSKDVNMCLDFEADRMLHLLLRKKDHDSEMTVVRNELERDEDEPSRLLQNQIFSTAFQEHPYHHPVIGWRSDVENVPISRLRKFYNDFYWPDNATLVIIGDYDTVPLLRSIAHYFGGIPHAPQPYPRVYTQEPPQEGERRFTVQRGVELPRVAIGYRGVKSKDKDVYALDVLNSIMGDESKKSSRLYRALIDGGLATEVSANNMNLHDPGMFLFSATANVQSKPEQLEKALQEQIEKVKDNGVTPAELDRAKKSVVKMVKLQISDIAGLSEYLTESIATADWQWLTEYPKYINAVTAADVQRVARKYFQTSSQTTGYYLPKSAPPGSEIEGKPEEKLAANQDVAPPSAVPKTSEKLQQQESAPAGQNSLNSASPLPSATSKQPPATADAAGRPGAGATAANSGSTSAISTATATATTSSTTDGAPSASDQTSATETKPANAVAAVSESAKSADRIASIAPSQTPAISPISSVAKGRLSFHTQVRKFELPNGLTLLVMPIKGTGTVAISGRVRAGEYFRDPNKAQVPSLVADLLTAGSQKYTKEALAQELEQLGTTLNYANDDFWLAFNTEVTTEDVSTMIPLAADTLQHPLFTETELAKSKKLRESLLKDAMADTGSMAYIKFMEYWYKPDSVYYNKPFPKQIAELSTIGTQDLHQFHDKHITPANTVLTLVGDITPDRALAIVKSSFGEWHGPPAETVHISPNCVVPHATQKTLISELPEKSNADVTVGHPVSVSILSHDYFATQLANAALGYDSFACRLAPVRETYGLTYGISSGLSGEFPWAPWMISFSINPENYGKTLPLVEKIVREYLKSGITPEELEKEKSHLEGSFYVKLRSPQKIASRLCELEILGLGPQFIDDFAANLRRVTVSQANTCIRKYFNLNTAAISAAGTLTDADKAPK